MKQFMKRYTLFLAAASVLASASPVVAKHLQTDTAQSANGSVADKRAPSARDYGYIVANWQVEAAKDTSYLDYKEPQSAYDRGWVKGTFYVGLDRFARGQNDQQLFTYLRQVSIDNGFELGHRYWHGDDQLIAEIYAFAAEREQKPEYLDMTRSIFDKIIAANYSGDLAFTPTDEPGMEGACQRRWCWADAIFMAPPAWAHVSRITGDPRYADYAAKETRAIIEYLQDPKTGLMFRDSNYFERKTENGKPVFWSRGNGWVFAGLARFIEALPEDHKDRPLFIATFQQMAKTLITIQREDGYWPTSLLDPDLLTNPETSGTGFFGFGLAWGINNGLLKGPQYSAARDKAWLAMKNAIGEDGHLGWVQQIGRDPQKTSAQNSQFYGSGGFLLMASEMIVLEE